MLCHTGWNYGIMDWTTRTQCANLHTWWNVCSRCSMLRLVSSTDSAIRPCLQSSDHLMSLNLLRITERIRFKLAVLVHRATSSECSLGCMSDVPDRYHWAMHHPIIFDFSLVRLSVQGHFRVGSFEQFVGWRNVTDKCQFRRRLRLKIIRSVHIRELFENRIYLFIFELDYMDKRSRMLSLVVQYTSGSLYS